MKCFRGNKQMEYNELIGFYEKYLSDIILKG